MFMRLCLPNCSRAHQGEEAIRWKVVARKNSLNLNGKRVTFYSAFKIWQPVVWR